MSKLLHTLIEFFRQWQRAQRERDRFSGTTTRPSSPPSRAADSRLRIEYTPDLDGEADPGEVVWAWVPFREDPTRGKDRPVVIVGRVGDRLAGVPLTSKRKDRDDHVPVGTGAWDSKRRDSWAKVDQVITVEPDAVRREGAILARDRFDAVIRELARHHDVHAA